MPRMVKLILTESGCKGKGTPEEPYYRTNELYTMSGEFVAAFENNVIVHFDRE